MGVGVTRGVALRGIAGHLVDIECHVGQGLPAFEISGLPDTALRQAPQRVRAATISAGFSLNSRQLTFNLSPAAIPKHGTGFDLGIAVAALAACGELPADAVRPVVHCRAGPRRPVAPCRRRAAGRARGPARRVRAGPRRSRRCGGGPAGRGAAGLHRPHPRGGGAGLRPDCARRELPPAAVAAPAAAAGRESGARRVDLADVSGQHEARAALMLAAAGGTTSCSTALRGRARRCSPRGW